MYLNLLTEIKSRNLTIKEFAKAIEIKHSTFMRKFKGKVDFNLLEVKRIKKFFDGKFTIDYLMNEA